MLNLDLIILLSPSLNTDRRSAPGEYNEMKSSTILLLCSNFMPYCLLASKPTEVSPFISVCFSIAVLLLAVSPALEELLFSLLVQ